MHNPTAVSVSKRHSFTAIFRVRPVIAWLALTQLLLIAIISVVSNDMPRQSSRLQLIEISQN